MVPQRAYLFSGTVATNLRFGNPDATDDAAVGTRSSSRRRKDFVEAMPQKLDAPIAQGGTNVSGGQRQRLVDRARAAARARRAASSTTRSPRSISRPKRGCARRSRRGLAHATVIVVAQRVASIRHAASDHRARRRQASSATARTPSSLATCPTYAEIVTSQTEEQEVAA